MTQRILTVIIVMLFSNVLICAQSQHLNQSRGFDPNGVYSSKEIDNVNLFNGALTLTIPIGSPYKVRANLSYSLTLVYNSNLWNQEEQCGVAFNSDPTVWAKYGSQGELLWMEQPFPNGNDGEIITPRDTNDDCYTISTPNPETNAGMGWQMTLGRLYPPRFDQYHPLTTERQNWVYVAPDGSEHSFYDKLHDTDSEADSSVWYTRDNSYLRMKIISSAQRIVEFPNGEVHQFTNFGLNNNPDWRLTKISDQFANYVNVNYEGDPDGNGVKDWILTDSQLRQQVIYFHKPANDYQPVILRIDLTAFGGATGQYFFNYDTLMIQRAAPHVPNVAEYPPNINVPFLTSVTMPDGSSYQMPVNTSYDLTGEYSTAKTRGIIRGATLPTGARINWEYRAIDNPQTTDVDESKLYYGYPNLSSARAYKRRSVGVRRRTVSVGNETHLWTYDPRPEIIPVSAECPLNTMNTACLPKQTLTKVTTPEGHYSLHYFSMYPVPAFSQAGRNINDWHIADYGLPITKYPDKIKNDANGKSLFLSEEVYENKGANGFHLSRSTYLRYETDEIPYNDGYGSVIDTNRRVVAKRIVYNNDGDKYAETLYSQYDGLGHYRRIDTAGNFGAGDVKTERTNYNNSNCTYIINPATNNPDYSQPAPWGFCYSEFPTNRAWVLGTYDSRTLVEDNQSSRELFHFNDAGQLLRKRLLKTFGSGTVSPTANAKDIVVQLTYSASGNMIREDYFGGDGQTLDTTQPLGTMPLPASEYTTNHTYQYGILNGSQTVGVNFKSLDLDIDSSTGLVKTSRDQSGDPITYAYDKMGRITEIKPRDGGMTRIVYDRFNNGALANASVQHRTNDGASLLDEEKYFYDQMGRLSSEKQKMPGGSFIERVTTYTGSGWKSTVSEWGHLAQKTFYEIYDPFGRAQKITPPDHNSPHNRIIWMTYKGTREVRRTIKIATTASGEEDVDTTEIYDRQGRLSSVEEFSNYANPSVAQAVKTFYKYDTANRLKQVSTTAAGTTQNRFFTYDGRGFLNSEQHPELGASGNGQIQYLSYDSKGNLNHKIDGANQLKFFYDKASRMTRIEEACGAENRPCVGAIGNWQPLKEYSYYNTNNSAGGAYTLGKPASATRHNYIINPNSGAPVDVTYTEAYEYWSIDGRLSHRTTSSSLGTQFKQAFAYHPGGELGWQSYPTCVGSNNCTASNVSPDRQIWYTYANGLLTNVGSQQNAYAKQITYHPNGTISQIKHGVSGNLAAEGVIDNYVMDPNALPRARQIYTSGVVSGGNLDTGVYQYDGAGNIKKIGGDWFVYDKANRLVEGSSIAPWKKKQKYTYDSFGNITKKETFNNVTAPGTGSLLATDLFNTNPATNRYIFSSPTAYDASGNLKFGIYDYDSLNMMKTAPGKTFLYNPSDERIQIYDHSSGNAAYNRDTIVLRGLNNEVLREYRIYGGNTSPSNWEWGKDYIYAGTKLLSTEANFEGRRNYHLDHLGSPRLVTNNSQGVIASNQYLPFGEITSGVSSDRLDFTGHEKDLPTPLGGHVLHYMHARYYSAPNGKFMSVDPGRDWNPKQPQSWNMYAYVQNSPINKTDPNGRQSCSNCHWSPEIEMYEWASANNSPFGGPLETFILENLTPGGSAKTTLINTGKSMVSGLIPIPLKPAAISKTLGVRIFDRHHIFNAFRGNSYYRLFFQSRNIDVDKFTVEVTRALHRNGIHGAGNDWTKHWKTFIDKNPAATLEETLEFAQDLMKRYKIDNLPIVNYRTGAPFTW